MSIPRRPRNEPNAPASEATPFPVVVGAALLAGGGIALLAAFNKRAATIVSLTLLAGIVLNRRIVDQFNDLVSTVTGR